MKRLIVSIYLLVTAVAATAPYLQLAGCTGAVSTAQRRGVEGNQVGTATLLGEVLELVRAGPLTKWYLAQV